MTIMPLRLTLERLAQVADGPPLLPGGHHGGFHMNEWPWWPGPMHFAYPLLFVAGLAIVVVLLWRRS